MSPAAPVVVTALSSVTLVPVIITQQSTLIVASNGLQMTSVMDSINQLPASTWNNGQDVEVVAGRVPPNFTDTRIAPTSLNAKINVNGGGPRVSPLFTLTNGAGDEPDWLNWARIGVVIAAGIAVTGGALGAFVIGPAIAGGAAASNAGAISAWQQAAVCWRRRPDWKSTRGR